MIALKVNKTLQTLNFRFNEVSDTGASAIGAALKLNTALTELDFGGNLYSLFIIVTYQFEDWPCWCKGFGRRPIQ